MAVTGLFGFQTLSANAPFYTPGPGARTLAVAGLPPFAPLICYEVIFARFAPRGADRPQFLLNVSNDAWYGNSAGPRQHLKPCALPGNRGGPSGGAFCLARGFGTNRCIWPRRSIT